MVSSAVSSDTTSRGPVMTRRPVPMVTEVEIGKGAVVLD
jgi:hypothetical protein